MLYRKYGTTDDKVSAIGFGGMRFEDQKNIDACAELVQAAHNNGITYFDTAPGYQDSEDLFGVAFKEMNKIREQKPFFVSTKTFMAEPDQVRKELETSLKRMNLEYIDFYHVWCVLTKDAYEKRKQQGVIEAFEQLKSEGLIRHICISSHMTGTDIGDVLNDYPFEGVLLGYSAMNFSYRDAALDAAASLNRAVVVMNPLGGGIIPKHPDRFDFLRTRAEETVVDAALGFLLNDPRITVSLVGFANQKDLQETIHAVENFKPLEQEQIDSIRNNLKDTFDELCTGCQYCDNCPEEIPIPKMMDAYNHYMLEGTDTALLNRLKWHWGIGADNDVISKCIACGQCEDICTQKLPIINRLEEIRYIAENYMSGQK